MQFYFPYIQWDNAVILGLHSELTTVNTLWQLAESQLELHRYPKGLHDKSLQAWDSADELIVNHLSNLPKPIHNPLILEDNFGALSVALNHLSPTVLTDSFISKQAIIQNCQINNLTTPELLDSLTPLPDSELVVIKLTKNIGYLEFLIQQIIKRKKPCLIVASGKTTLVTSNVIKLFEKYFIEVSTSLAKKKSRLIFSSYSPNSNVFTDKYPVSVNWQEQGLILQSHANVFSKDQIDIGGRFLAEHLPNITDKQEIIDLGCGNGLLGIACLNQVKSKGINAKVTFVDESFMAVSSAKLNVESLFPADIQHCQFRQDDCLTQQPDRSVDLILCNPPFHQQNAITEHIAIQMFNQSFSALRKGGCLFVVANRHLPYQEQLKKCFGGFKVAHQNSKFVIYQCNKLS